MKKERLLMPNWLLSAALLLALLPLFEAYAQKKVPAVANKPSTNKSSVSITNDTFITTALASLSKENVETYISKAQRSYKKTSSSMQYLYIKPATDTVQLYQAHGQTMLLRAYLSTVAIPVTPYLKVGSSQRAVLTALGIKKTVQQIRVADKPGYQAVHIAFNAGKVSSIRYASTL